MNPLAFTNDRDETLVFRTREEAEAYQRELELLYPGLTLAVCESAGPTDEERLQASQEAIRLTRN